MHATKSTRTTVCVTSTAVGPDLIMSSPAARALATANVVAQGLDCKTKNIAVDDRLCAAKVVALRAVIEALDDRLDRVMLVGHNPGLTELAHHFDSPITYMSTCALAEFRPELAEDRASSLSPWKPNSNC